MRRIILALLSLLLLIGSPSVLAQDVTSEPGTTVDKATEQAVVQAAKTWAANASKANSAVVAEMTDALQQSFLDGLPGKTIEQALRAIIIAPIKIIKVRNVRRLSDGRYAVDVTYSGYFGAHWYINSRWLFVKSGSRYVLDFLAPPTSTYVPSSMTHQEIKIDVSAGTPTVNGKSAIKIVQTDVVFFQATIHDGGNVTPLGIYRLNDGVKVKSGLSTTEVTQIGVVFAAASDPTTQGYIDVAPGTYVLAPVVRTGDATVPDPAVAPLVLTIRAPKTTPATVSTPAAIPASPEASPTS